MKLKPVRDIESLLLRRMALAFWVVFVPPLMAVFTLWAFCLNLWTVLFGEAHQSLKDYTITDWIFVKAVLWDWYTNDLPAMWRASSCSSLSPALGSSSSAS